MTCNGIPPASYGVLQRDEFDSPHEDVAEQVRRLGYAILDSGYTSQELEQISDDFNAARKAYHAKWGIEYLRGLDELHTLRALLTHGGNSFLQLAINPNLMAVLKLLVTGKFILGQQNGIINPPGETYNQAAWHRDLPYQHYVSSSPLAVNALFCVDDFTLENGSTYVLPSSHKTGNFPSEAYMRKNALQIEAKAGQYILLDCMLFHSGGFNRTVQERRAVNHVYGIPYLKQQINLPRNMKVDGLSAQELEIFGFEYQEPDSIESFLAARAAKCQK